MALVQSVVTGLNGNAKQSATVAKAKKLPGTLVAAGSLAPSKFKAKEMVSSH